MSLFKRLSTYLGYNNEPSRLVEFNGYFYHYHNGRWSCLFNDCELVILKKGDGKYNYCIQVTRIVESEDDIKQPENEDDEEEANSFEFPITVGLELYREMGPLDGVALSWKGTRSRFLFEFDKGQNQKSVAGCDRLQSLLCQCIYESKYQQHHSTGSINEIENFCREQSTATHKPIQTNVNTLEAKKVEVPLQQQSDQQPPESPVKSNFYPTNIIDQEQQQILNNQDNDKDQINNNANNVINTPPQPLKGKEVFRSHCSLYLESNGQFNLKDADVYVLMNNTSTTPKSVEYTFYIVKNENVILSQIINSDMYPHFFNEQDSFIWFSGINANCFRWSIRFDSTKEYEAFRDKYTIFHYEGLNQTKFKGKDDDVKFLANTMTDDLVDNNIVFDTDDGFNAKDLEDFEQLNISSSDFEQELKDYKHIKKDIKKEEEEEESEEEESEEEEEEESEEEEEEEESEEEEEPIKVNKQRNNTKVPVIEESESEEEEEEEEESEEEESEEEEEEEPIKVVKQRNNSKVPVIEESSEEEEEEESEEEESEEEEEEDESEEERIEFSEDLQRAKNSELLVGYKDKSFVVRGSNIGVFSAEEDDVKLNSVISGIRDKKGIQFSPTKLMLQQQDASLLMMNKNNRSKVFKMDLNRPDIVQEWDLNWHNQPTVVSSILPQHKFDQTTDTQTFVGLNGNGLCLIDPRQRENKVAMKFVGASTTTNLNTCATTAADGQIAIGTNKGDIKLFSNTQFDPNKKSASENDPAGRQLRSRTTIPGIGDPIVAIDTTKDGKWIVATCKNYLVIVATENKSGLSGYKDRLGDSRPSPRRLILKPTDLKRMGGVVNFTPARFNIAPGDDLETSIVTSSGRFLITWNFRKIKQNQLDIYQIQEFKQDIVADHFKFNKDNSIIVTLPNDVCLSKKISLKK